MSSAEDEKTSAVPKTESRFRPTIFSNAPNHLDDHLLSQGRKNLKKWLGLMVRVTLKNKMTVMGIFSCTDHDQNIVLDCSAFNEIGMVIVTGNQIDKFEVNMPQNMEQEMDKGAKQSNYPEKVN
ncbi:GH11291 [Drosophila grimshawi]|uniref:GH11291 n=1 Tax=Drosophila grimshawi TaxID=7222 RepID=B4JE19_DROGR|nr:GH11291 [Drosophila grimshawi]